MTYRTYNDWFAKGRVVQEGQKAAGFLSDGIAVFSKDQTVKIPRGVNLKYPEPDSYYLGDEYDYN